MKKFDNYVSALENLKDIYKYDEPYENVVLTGLVALFEICFEQSWKAMKEILEDNGFAESATGSPKQIIKLAYRAGMIKDEDKARQYWDEHSNNYEGFERLRRITGYLVGTLDRWNDGKKAEEKARVKHSVGQYSMEEKVKREELKQEQVLVRQS